MEVTFKQLLETSYVQVNTKIEELKRFMDMTKTYSIKTNSHIKIITNLVNELTDSDDILKFVDTELAVANVSNSYNHTTNITRGYAKGSHYTKSPAPFNSTSPAQREGFLPDEGSRSVNLNDKYNSKYRNQFEVPASNEDQELGRVIERYKKENQKLWESLKKGQSDTDFIKGVFEKLLDSYTKQGPGNNPHIMPFVPGSNNMFTDHNRQNTRQHSGQTPVSQSLYIPANAPKHNFIQDINSEKFNETESAKSTKNPGERDAEGRKRQSSESGINGILKQYIDLKKEFESYKEEKNKQILDLTQLLEENKNNSYSLLRELEELSISKKSLENSTRDLLQSIKVNSGPSVKTLEQKLNDMNNEVASLVQRIDSLTAENESLKRKANLNRKNQNEDDFYRVKLLRLEADYKELEDANNKAQKRNDELMDLVERNKETKTKVRTISDSSTVDTHNDLLKCLYMQADYIESGLQKSNYDSIVRF